MDYTAAQRDIIRQIGEISAQIETMTARHRAAEAAQVTATEDVVAAMVRAIYSLRETHARSVELAPLLVRHGDLWREFLDTL